MCIEVGDFVVPRSPFKKSVAGGEVWLVRKSTIESEHIIVEIDVPLEDLKTEDADFVEIRHIRDYPDTVTVTDWHIGKVLHISDNMAHVRFYIYTGTL